MLEAIGWVIGAAIVVAAAKGWKCWYQEHRGRYDLKLERVKGEEMNDNE